MRTITETLAANQTKLFEVAGNYFEILTCANDLTRIDWVGEDGQQLDPWQLVKEGVFAAEPFRAFNITNGPTAQTIKVMVGRGTGGNRSVPVSGNVGVSSLPIGIGEARSKAGQAYAAGMSQAAIAAACSVVSFRNVPGSGKTAVVTSIKVTADAAGRVFIDRGTTASAVTVPGVRKRLSVGGTVTSSMGLVAGNQSGVVSQLSANLGVAKVAAGVPHVIDLLEPLVVDEGVSVLVVLETQNTGLTVSFDWVQE
jgi:hypothetical protein